jgi:hypothetical protein
MVGAWCFVDHRPPRTSPGRPRMQVPPHPHTGLQTVLPEPLATRERAPRSREPLEALLLTAPARLAA